MRIAIDISQIVYEGTGVSTYVRKLVAALIRKDTENEYVLFGASLRKRNVFKTFISSLTVNHAKLQLVSVPIPPTVLHVLWNVLHIVPAEWFTGPVDVFWSSDWTQPPLSGAIGITTIHDLSIMKFPETLHSMSVDVAHARISSDIVKTQMARLKHAVRECKLFLCDSEATKADAKKLLHIPSDRLTVVYPGYP
jgi:hypothetical protein